MKIIIKKSKSQLKDLISKESDDYNCNGKSRWSQWYIEDIEDYNYIK